MRPAEVVPEQRVAIGMLRAPGQPGEALPGEQMEEALGKSRQPEADALRYRSDAQQDFPLNEAAHVPGHKLQSLTEHLADTDQEAEMAVAEAELRHHGGVEDWQQRGIRVVHRVGGGHEREDSVGAGPYVGDCRRERSHQPLLRFFSSSINWSTPL